MTIDESDPTSSRFDDLFKPTGAEVAASYLLRRATGVREEVAGNVVLSQGFSDLQNDRAELAELVGTLVKAKVLSSEEALLGLEGKSHLSMLTTIGKYAHVILHESILPYLQPGYSVLYQLVLLYKDLEALDECDRTTV